MHINTYSGAVSCPIDSGGVYTTLFLTLYIYIFLNLVLIYIFVNIVMCIIMVTIHSTTPLIKA